MTMLEVFREHKQDVCAAWVELVLSTYSLDTKGFLRTKNDPFLNPVGDITRLCAGCLYDAMAGEDIDAAKLKDALERLVKLRAVQIFTASEALGIFYAFKSVVRSTLLPLMEKSGLTASYLEAESRIDTLALMAFDMYAKDREVVLENRVNEIKNQHAQLLRWAQTVDGSPVGGSGKTKL